MQLVHTMCFELGSDMSGAFGVFGAFSVKTIRFYLYFTYYTRALLVHPFLVKTIKITYNADIALMQLSCTPGAFSIHWVDHKHIWGIWCKKKK